MLGAKKTEYKENKALQDGTWYSYRVTAAYNGIECESAPFKARYGNEYCVKVYYSLTGVEESEGTSSRVYPNPVEGQLTVEGEEMTDLVVCDLLGQQLMEQHGLGGVSSWTLPVDNLSPGLYLIKINGKQGVSSHCFVKK